MDRYTYIERCLRQIYGGYVPDDSAITFGLCNSWLNDGIALAAKQNYKENIQIDGIGYVNNSFYTTFKNLSISQDEVFRWKVTLPEIPLGLGTSNGLSSMVIKDNTSSQLSYPIVWLSQNQVTYARGMRAIPNKVLAYSEGTFVYILSTLLLNEFTAQCTMVSGGDSSDLDSTINVPADYFNVIVEYLKQQLLFQRSQPVDSQNDGLDAIRTT